MPVAEPTEDDLDLIATTDGRVPGRRGLATRQRLLGCTAVAVVEGFMDYWERNRAVFRVVELTTVEGDLRFQGLRVRALNAVTVTLARVIATQSGTLGSPAGSDPMAAAGTLIAMLAQVAGHRYGFEFWGIRTASLVDSQARLLHWSVTGRPVVAGARVPGSESPLPRTGPVVGGGAASARTAQAKPRNGLDT